MDSSFLREERGAVMLEIVLLIVFTPIAVLMVVGLLVTLVRYSLWIIGGLLAIAAIVFLIYGAVQLYLWNEDLVIVVTALLIGFGFSLYQAFKNS